MITCAYLFGVCCRSRGLNSNTFLDSSDCFVRLRKNSLPVSVVAYIKALVNEDNHIVADTLLPMMFLGLRKLGNITFVADTKCF